MNEQLLAQIINNMRVNNPQGAVGNVSDTEMSMFSGNPMNGAVAGATEGSVGNVSNREVDMINRLNKIKEMGQNRILTDGEKQEAMFIQKMLPPVDLLPVDIDGASAGNALTKEQLDALLNRIYQMQGVR